MNALTQEFASSGFRVLAFPCNNFGMQEPGSGADEILNGIKYVRPGGGFVADFDFFQKIDVNGDNEHPFYTFLKSRCGPTTDLFDERLFYSPKRVGDVRWNFEIFIIDRQGMPLYRYHHRTPTEEVRQDLLELMQQPIVNSESLDTEPEIHIDNQEDLESPEERYDH